MVSWPAKDFNLILEDVNLENYLIIDIREHSEDRCIKLNKNELHIPFSELLDQPSNIPQGKLLLYCKSGVRSNYAAFFLQKNGFNAFSLESGIIAISSE